MSHFSPAHSPEFKMHYEVYDDLLPRDTLFIHGNLASNKWWYPSIEELKGQAKLKPQKGRAILAEWRGCGESSAPQSFDEVDMELFARDYVALTEQLALKNVDLVGHSTGGIIALLACALKPELYRSLFLLDSVGAKGVVFVDGMYEAFEQMKASAELTGQVIGSTIYNHDPENSFFKASVAPAAHRAVQAVGAWVIQSLADFDATERIRKISQPTLVIHGRHDQTLPIADSQELAELLPRGRFEVWEDCGHCANIEQPSLFAHELLNFLESRG